MSERSVDLDYLGVYRRRLAAKCEGLTPEQLVTRSVPPSTLSLLGLVRHLSGVEHSWNRRVLQGHPELAKLYRDHPSDPDWDFNGVEPTQACVDHAWAQWRGEVAAAEEWIAADDFDRVVDVDGERVEVRDVVVHLIEEYARHCGHADLLRECIDGRVGQ